MEDVRHCNLTSSNQASRKLHCVWEKKILNRSIKTKVYYFNGADSSLLDGNYDKVYECMYQVDVYTYILNILSKNVFWITYSFKSTKYYLSLF